MQETTRHARDSDACVCAMHVHHEEETRAPLMRVTSEVRLDQATWSSNARTLRVVMKETSEMRLWRELASHARAWDRLHCPYLDSTDAAEQTLRVVHAVRHQTLKNILEQWLQRVGPLASRPCSKVL